MISVALPVIKTKFFEKALRSILDQTFTDFELIVVNNNSPEDVESIVKKYNDSRIRYIRHDTMYPIIENWNKCLWYAQGEYFVLFSDDDIAEPGFLEELHRLSQKYPSVNIFHSRVRIIDGNDKVVSLTSSSPEFESAADFIWHRFKNLRMHYAPEFMCRTEALRNLGGFIYFRNAWGSDDATWFSIANTGGIAASDEFLCSWRQSDYNLSSAGSLEAKLEAVKSFGEWTKEFITGKLVIPEKEKETLKEILQLHPRRIQTQFAVAFRFSLGTGFSAYYKTVLCWFRYRRKYSLSLYSVVWALMLIYKDRGKLFR